MPKKKGREPTLLVRLAEAVGAYYAKDPSRASVVVSSLENGSWYCSVVRYSEPYGRGKQMVTSSTMPTLRDAVTKCAANWQREFRPVATKLSALDRTVRAMDEGVR